MKIISDIIKPLLVGTVVSLTCQEPIEKMTAMASSIAGAEENAFFLRFGERFIFKPLYLCKTSVNLKLSNSNNA